MATPLSTLNVLDREFLAVRARLIDLAATLDRMERAEGNADNDPRLDKIRRCLEILADDAPERTERIQMAFSLGYKEDWRKDYGF